MDFSSKQAMGVIVVIGIAALVIAAAIILTNQNTANAKTQTSNINTKVNEAIKASNDKVEAPTEDADQENIE